MKLHTYIVVFCSLLNGKRGAVCSKSVNVVTSEAASCISDSEIVVLPSHDDNQLGDFPDGSGTVVGVRDHVTMHELGRFYRERGCFHAVQPRPQGHDCEWHS